MRDVIVYFSFFGRGLIVWEVEVPGFLLVVNCGREWLNMHPSSYTYGVRGLIKGRCGGGSFLFLYIVGPILDLLLLSFCFWGLDFGGTLNFWGWGGDYLSEPWVWVWYRGFIPVYVIFDIISFNTWI